MPLLDLSKEFAGRRALVTGGARGIGAAAAQRLIDGGAKVVVASRSRHEQTPSNATFISGDVSTESGAKELAAATLQELGGLDILVNAAGAARVHMPNSEAVPDAEWVDSLNINFLSALRVSYAVLPALRQSKAASIINVSSGSSLPYHGSLLHYGAAKAALNNFSQGLAKELAPEKIRVNVVTPGPVITPGGDAIREDIVKGFGIPMEAFFAQVPLGRPGEVSDLAEMIAFLASDRASWITGHNHFVTGGWGDLA
jgi:NAD(P)-dependent dehydrogenase (short-subunit alcohol dehydrogenase family)